MLDRATAFDNFGEDEELAIALDRAVRDSKEPDFRHNDFRERRIKAALFTVLQGRFGTADETKSEVERVYNIVVNQGEY